MNFLMMFMITKKIQQREREYLNINYYFLQAIIIQLAIKRQRVPSKYGPNRKMLNDIKLRLFGNKTDTASTNAYRSLSIDKAIAYMFGGLKRLEFQNNWDGTLFRVQMKNNKINITKVTQSSTQDQIDSVKNNIKNIKVDGNQLKTDMLPLNMSLRTLIK